MAMNSPAQPGPARAAPRAGPADAPAASLPGPPDAGLELACPIAFRNLCDAVLHLRVEGADRYRVIDANPAYFETSHFTPGQVLGKLISDFIPEPPLKSILANYREAVRTGLTQRWQQVSEYPSGKKIAHATVTPVCDAQRKCTDLVVTVHDITELKLREEELERANAKLEQAMEEQHRLAEAVRRNEERLNLALEGAGEGVWDWRIEDGRVVYSAQWKRVVGLPEDFPGDDLEVWFSRVYREDFPALMEQIEECLASPSLICTHEFRVRHEAGRTIWVRIRSSVVERAPDGKARRMVGTIADITDNVLLRQQLEASHTLLAQLAQQVPGALFEFVMDDEGRFACTYISAMSQELFEVSPEECMRDMNTVMRRIIPSDCERLEASRAKSARTLEHWREEFQIMLPSKGLCWREVNATPMRRKDGATVWHGFTDDISARKNHELTIRQFNEKLERRAHYDPLTGLPNRSLFRDRLVQGMCQAREAQAHIALLFLDLDRFKEVNDLLGHDAGDRLLVDAARRIQGCVRPGDTVARLGGDEFTVILTEPRELEHVERTAQAILEALAQPFSLGVEQAHVSGSIGIALFPDDGSTPEELMRHADHAMYRSKSAGRNQLTFFEVSMQASAMHRLKLASDLRRALPEQQLVLFYQPIVSLVSGKIRKAEALLRWRRPGVGLVAPGQFVAIAEESGLIHEIGNWVFSTAALNAKRWSALIGRPFQISINKSPVQFQHHARSMDWIAFLHELDLPPDCISVEITEGLLLNMSDRVLAKLSKLHQGGVEVAIDDFGTGYSSMSYLKRLDIDYLKIDQSFVAEMLHDSTSRTITETIIVMAHKLGLKVIAEGVETPEQREWLSERKCDYAQGFLFGAPVEAAEFEQLLLA